MTKSTKQLRTALDAAIRGYIRKFEEVHGIEFDFAVDDDLTGTLNFGDCYFNMSDVVYDINNKLPIGLILEWYWAGLEAYQRNKNIPQINLRSYASGLRFEGQV